MPSPRGDSIPMGGKVKEKSMSFHGRGSLPARARISRPMTVPDLSPARHGAVSPAISPEMVKPRLTKILLNVTVQGSVGPVQVLMNLESNVGDLICAALKQYVKEGRRPVISCSGADEFDIHYSQFSLESLNREEKLSALGSRNFFLCKRKTVVDGGVNGGAPAVSCSKQADKAAKLGSSSPWLKFMSFLF